MKQLTSWELAKIIANDYNIELSCITKTYYNQFPIKNGKKKIHATHDSIIVDKEGNEFPYMKSTSQRNNEKLEDFDYIYVVRNKSLLKVIEEAGTTIESKPCRICEGNGWTSAGRQYIYKDMYCEV